MTFLKQKNGLAYGDSGVCAGENGQFFRPKSKQNLAKVDGKTIFVYRLGA